MVIVVVMVMVVMLQGRDEHSRRMSIGGDSGDGNDDDSG